MNLTGLDALIDEIIVDAYGDDEQLEAFRQALEDEASLPVDGVVSGAPVKVISFDYDGDERRGLTAQCRRENGTKHTVAVAELEDFTNERLARYMAAYRKWMGLAPYTNWVGTTARRETQREAKSSNPDLVSPIEIVVVSMTMRETQCRLLGSECRVLFCSPQLERLVPGVIAKVVPRRQWKYAGRKCLTGEVATTRLDMSALGLTPLRLEPRGIWDPTDEYWGEEGEPVEDWIKKIIAWGPRPSYEMEQVLPMNDPDDPDSDPIVRSNDLKDAGDFSEASRILMGLCEVDLRCLDAHSHLGNMVFEDDPAKALCHYEVGMRIGELSLDGLGDGVLPWGWIDNRPWLRCLNGYGLCLWRLGNFKEAEHVFDRVLWLNPTDNQGVRFNIEAVRARKAWTAK
jgi:hypothetical protein